jgi:DNA-binding beta-propeller fold protein YncE
VADDDNSLIWLFGSTGSMLSNLGEKASSGAQAGQASSNSLGQPWLDGPQGVAFGPNNTVYVADTNHDRVVVYDAGSGAFLFSWGKEGSSGNDAMMYPTGICVQAGKVYVADSGNYRVLVYDTAGNFIQSMGSRGEGPGQFISLFAVVADGLGRVWAADEALNTVTVFNPDGSVAAVYGTDPSLTFQELTALTVSPDGTVMVGDGQTNNVYLWRTGAPIALYGAKPTPSPTPEAAGSPSAGLNQATLAFGPVPAKAGEPVSVRLPFAAQQIHWEIYSADMRMVAQGTEYASAEATYDQTADLASGVYIARLQASDGSASRQVIQKLVFTR